MNLEVTLKMDSVSRPKEKRSALTEKGRSGLLFKKLLTYRKALYIFHFDRIGNLRDPGGCIFKEVMP